MWMPDLGDEIRRTQSSLSDSVRGALKSVASSERTQQERDEFRDAISRVDSHPDAYAQVVALLCNSRDGTWLEPAEIEPLSLLADSPDAMRQMHCICRA